MRTQHLQNNISRLHYILLEKNTDGKCSYKLSLLENSKRFVKRRNLLLFSVVYGVILGSILFMLLNA